MSDNLESFVKKLQSEGVDAGKKAADGLRKEAEQEAEKILARAREAADGIVQQAETEAEQRRNRTQAELEMAARDVMLRLRESLSRALSALINRRVQEGFQDPDYLREIVKDVVVAYAKEDAGAERQIKVEVSEDIPDGWIDAIFKDLSRQLQDPEEAIKVEAALSRAGFDYRVAGATIEVSPDSVTEVLLEMVNPELQKVIQRAVEDAAA
ncbi:MAG: hypothetical protein JRL30_05130 [Deltaproteobacteria bacterium]|nr:hypothetical protein [Deltaproteobacteria bacterium]